MQALNTQPWSSCVWLSLQRQERQHYESLNGEISLLIFLGKNKDARLTFAACQEVSTT